MSRLNKNGTPARRLRRFLLSAAFVASAVFARAEVKVGDAFPALASAGLVNLAGGEVPATADKVVLVDFWASWCAPCKASFPALAKIHTDLAPKGLQVIAVSVDEKPAEATKFWKKLAPPFTAVLDRDLKLVHQVIVPTMPTTYVLDRTGKVRFIHPGFHGDATDRDLRKEIETLLAEKS